MDRKHIAITAAVAAAAVILVGGIGLACTGLLNGEPDKATPENSLPSTDKPVQDAKQQISAPDESGDAVQPLPSTEGSSGAAASGEGPEAAGDQPAPESGNENSGGNSADNTVDFGSPGSDNPSDEQKPPAEQSPSGDGERWTGYY